MNTESPKASPKKPAAAAAPQPVRVHTANLKSSYCNTMSANITREEVVLNFGINQNWDRGSDASEISLEHRIILSPFAAKRLAQLLQKLVADYEGRHGELK
jgi:Protein of unknown function (DUF3467)